MPFLPPCPPHPPYLPTYLSIHYPQVLPGEARAAHVLPVLLAAAGDRSWRVRWSAASKYEGVCQAFLVPAEGGGGGEGQQGAFLGMVV